jgi:glycosyltransferase involved in cell wall biosynthesis
MKILYLSCHGILEFDEIRMLTDMGHHVFSPSGNYQTPDSQCSFRPKIPNLKFDQEDLDIYNKTWYIWDYSKIASKEFVDRFDVVYVMGMFGWVRHNWESFKHKPVIFRTIGQSNRDQEREISEFKKDKPNLKIVRYSPTERNYQNYAGEDAVIRFSKRSNEWQGWRGDKKTLVTVVQSMKRRRIHCSWDVFDQISKKVPTVLYGGDNPEVEPSLFKGSPTYEELQEVYRNYRCYFYAGTIPANYTLNFMEAWMTGMPILALDSNMIRDDNVGVYEIPNLIDHGSSGFMIQSIEELTHWVQQLFESESFSKYISMNSRKMALELFDESNNVPHWENFFKTL